MKTIMKLFAASLVLMATAQISAMHEMGYKLACKQLGVRENATQKEVNNVFEKKRKEFNQDGTKLDLLRQAKAEIDAIIKLRTTALAKGVYKPTVIKSKNTGLFTLKKKINEDFGVQDKYNTIKIDAYDYGRIGAVTLGIFTLGFTSYIFRNQLSSLFDARIKPVFTPMFNYFASKTPKLVKNFWSK